MKVKDIMLRDLSAIEANTSVAEFLYIIRKCGLSSLPVVDDEDRIVGIVSERDIIGALLHDYHETLHGTPFAPNPNQMTQKLEEVEAQPVEGYMTSTVITVADTADDLYVADMMINQNLKMVPVINTEGRLVGLVRRIDLLQILA